MCEMEAIIIIIIIIVVLVSHLGLTISAKKTKNPSSLSNRKAFTAPNRSIDETQNNKINDG